MITDFISLCELENKCYRFNFIYIFKVVINTEIVMLLLSLPYIAFQNFNTFPLIIFIKWTEFNEKTVRYHAALNFSQCSTNQLKLNEKGNRFAWSSHLKKNRHLISNFLWLLKWIRNCNFFWLICKTIFKTLVLFAISFLQACISLIKILSPKKCTIGFHRYKNT